MTKTELDKTIQELRAHNTRTTFPALEAIHEADLEGQDRDTEEATAHRYAHPLR